MKSDKLLPFVDAGELPDEAPPERRWVLDQWLPLGSAALLTGLGSTGKTLIAQQLMTCIATGSDFLGLPVRPGVGLLVSAEEDRDELWRRQHAINRALGIEMSQLRGRLFLMSWKGDDEIALGDLDQKGKIRPTPRWHALSATIKHLVATDCALDHVGHLFAGDENNRTHVAGFVRLLDRLAIDMTGSSLLLGHPNKAGAEFSGSTGWENHVRSRLFLDVPKDDLDPDRRVLSRSKANYARRGETLEFRWHEWAFVRETDLPPDTAREVAAAAQATADNDIFIACLAERNRQKRAVSERPSRTYAPHVFAEMAQSRGIGKERLTRAMERLFMLDRIKRDIIGRDATKGRNIEGLVEVKS